MDGMKVLAQVIVAAGLVFAWPGPAVRQWLAPEVMAPTIQASPQPAVSDARAWFQAAKPYCNGVEVATRLRTDPPPIGTEGTGLAAACLALAGHVEEARQRIMTLPEADRWRAAGLVFEAGHPAADSGDEVAAGPLMELVVWFWPNHYMALYHAGASRYERGDLDVAREFLERFLDHYDQDDGWRRQALAMLADTPPS